MAKPGGQRSNRRSSVAAALGLAAAASITAAAGLTVLAATSCSGGYQCPSVAAPPGAFPTELASGTASSSADTTITASAGGSTYSLLVPKGALPPGTTVDILQGNPAVLAKYLPAGQGYVDAAAVGWQAPDGSTPTATYALSLSASNSQVSSADSLYQTTASGLTPAGGVSAMSGRWTASFTSDPGFVVAAPGVSTPTTGTRSNDMLLVAGLLLVIGITLLAARRHLSRHGQH